MNIKSIKDIFIKKQDNYLFGFPQRSFTKKELRKIKRYLKDIIKGKIPVCKEIAKVIKNGQ